ncbi:MAG: FCSD flavin-binding domain-containing protein [Pseudaminobacter sp.]
MKTRRQALGLIGGSAASFALGQLATPALALNGNAHIVIVGGGFGGATTARYLKIYAPDIQVTLIERDQRFYTCPFSNLVLGGMRDIDSISHGFDDLRSIGIEVVHADAVDVDNSAHTVTLSGGGVLSYDRLVLSPGIDMRWGAIEGYDEAAAREIPHAWKAGEQTILLKRQLDAMEDGGTFVICPPDNPFRCPPGPYERVSMVAHYFKQHKPKSKILILDAKDTFSKKALFLEGWQALYGDMIEWVGHADDGAITSVNAGAREVTSAFGVVHKADVLNVIPPQKAGIIAERAGVTNDDGWVPVKPETFQSTQVEDIYIVGDATIAAPMPKSGFCANAQGKVVAAAIVADLSGQEPPVPSWINTCYSLVGADYGISVADVYRVTEGKIEAVPDSGGVSPTGASEAFRAAEANYAVGWYASISRDIWGTRL